MASSSNLLSEDQLLCSICLDVFTDPVSTPCGHNFCMVCLKECWDSSSRFQCPLCMEEFSRRPELRVNTFISGLVAQFKKSVQVKSSRAPEERSSRPKKVLCDSCDEHLEAVKSCLDCGMSYCDAHLVPHKTAAKLKKHKLMEPVENLEDYICQKHERPLELFCRDDQTCVCQFCTEGDHRSHSTVPIEEESGEKKTQLMKNQAEVQQMIQDRLKMVEEVKRSVELSKKNTEQEKADSVEVFRALVRCIERSQAELLELMEEKQEAAERQAEEFIKELEQEITELKRRDTELEQLSHTEDHLHLLQVYPSLCRPPPTKNWTEVSINTPLRVESLRRALSQLQKELNKEMEKIPEIKLKRIQQYVVDVILDPDTAHPYLSVSEDGKQVRDADTEQNPPETPERFDECLSVLGKEGFSSRSFYYEVQVSGKTEWDLGVTTESSNRKGEITLSPENGYWTVWLRNNCRYKALDSRAVLLSLKQDPQKVGVFVDYEEGLVSFYDVEARSHIYSFTVMASSSSLEKQPLKRKKVLCDYCSEEKLEAVKSCLDCGMSYCDAHLMPHKTVAKHKKHKLMEPVENLEDYICQKHERSLELFCRDDQTCICRFCTEGDHRSHSTVPIEEESGERKTHLQKTQADVQQMIQDRLMKIEETKHSVELSRKNTEQEKAHSVEVFRALVRCIERSQAELLELMEEKQEAAERQAEEFIKELEQEITELKRRDTELEQLSHTEDHLHLLQVYPSLCRPPHTNNRTDVSINTHVRVETQWRALSQLQKVLKLIEKLLVIELHIMQHHAVDVTLDPDTAHPALVLSDDGKQVTHGGTEQDLPDNPKRFNRCPCVLGKEGFSSGRFYYEVQIKRKTKWTLGVTAESSNRKGVVLLSPKNGYWTLCLRNDIEYSALESPSVLLSLEQAPQKVGVFVNYEQGLVSFYDVEASSHIYSFTGQSFTEKLYPYFSPSPNDGEIASNTLKSQRYLVKLLVPSYTVEQLRSVMASSSSVEKQPLKRKKVLCDYCSEEKLEAVKSCLNCGVSYCDAHLVPHTTVAKHKKHKLMEPVENLEDYICQRHERPLELFCRDDQMCVCQFCTEGDHRSHRTVPIEEESGEKKTQLDKSQAEVQQMIQDRLKKIEEIKHSVELSKKNTEQEKIEIMEVFRALVRYIERSQVELLELMEEKQKAAERQAEEFIKELEQEITELKRRDTELEQLSHTEDHLHLLQVYPSLCRPPHTNSWTDLTINTPLGVETRWRALSQLQDELKIIEKLLMIELQTVQQYAVDLTLDPDTAHPALVLSDDGKQVTHGDTEQDLPDNPERFDYCPCVLGKEGFSSGRFYYEVQVSGKTEWTLGVTTESSDRKGVFTLSPEDGYWTVWLRNETGYEALDSPSVTLSLEQAPQKVGVFVDYEKNTEQEKADSVEVFRALVCCIERSQAELLELMEEKQEAAERQAEELIKELEQEITELTRRDTELEQLSHTEDHLHLLQVYPSLCRPPHTKDWTDVSIKTTLRVESLRRALSQLQEALNKEMEKIMVTVLRGPAICRWCWKDVCSRGCSVSQVSEKTEWTLGVARESVDRKGQIIPRPEDGCWIVCLREDVACVKADSHPVLLSFRRGPGKVGVFVDYEEGLVSFYDVENRSHIHSFTVMVSVSCLLSKDQLLCSICLDVFTDPVTTPCGHNFCMVCLKKSWDSSSHFQCPVCKKEFPTRPELSVNAFISGLAAQFKKSVQVKPRSISKKGPVKRKMVLCDYCSDEQLEAVKSCLDCDMSYCDAHLGPHKTKAKLKKHKLMEPVENLEDYICQRHKRPLELFCRDDQTCVCQFCTEGDHRSHSTVPIEEESGRRKTQLKKTQAEVQQMMQDHLKKIEEIKHSVEPSKKNTEQEKADSVEVFRALVRCIESQGKMLELMEEKQEAAERQAEELIKELEQEITELKRRDTELEQLSHTEDHLHLLQVYPSLCRPPPTKNWTDVSVKAKLRVERLRSALSQLQEALNKEMEKIMVTELKAVQQYAVDVTLDPDTAHPDLILSDDGKQVTHGDTEQDLPDNPERFDECVYVLGEEGFSSGRFYYEVQVSGNKEWDLGVTIESSYRKGEIRLRPEDGYWIVSLSDGSGHEALDSTSVPLSLKQDPQKVGVFVDYEEGLVSFYDVEARSHIYSFTGQSFTEKLYPFFSPCLFDEDESSARLIITPVEDD
ncbi:hypothetical protein NFI96_004372 [Prochilodus magdalenae]|nr:hypothetical protein NFI96_004372 [Prochilodus magdalenae]